MKRCMHIGYSIVVLCVGLIVVDFVAGRVFHLGVREVSRTMQPYFLSGHYYVFLNSRRGLEVRSKEGPAASGYVRRGGIYVYEPDRVIESASDRLDWLFRNDYSRYTVEEMDGDLGPGSRSVRIFVIGGSAAMGTLALGPNSKRETWHAILEKKLRDHFQFERIYIFNAAVGGFASTQERLVFELALQSRRPDMVIALNGANDTWLPLARGGRPGDPYQLCGRYALYYDDSLLRTLARHSYMARNLLQEAWPAMALKKREKRILSDPKRCDIFAESIRNVYCRNVELLLRRFRQEQVEGLVFLQPLRCLCEDKSRQVTEEDRARCGFVGTVYDHIARHFRNDKPERRFVDLAHTFSGESDHFRDWCHLDNEGQRILADDMFPIVCKFLKETVDERRAPGFHERNPVSGLEPKPIASPDQAPPG